jgi:hypothetical protein
MWDSSHDMLKPVLRTRGQRSPVRGLAICEQLQLLAAGHANGKVLLRKLDPRLRLSPSREAGDTIWEPSKGEGCCVPAVGPGRLYVYMPCALRACCGALSCACLHLIACACGAVLHACPRRPPCLPQQLTPTCRAVPLPQAPSWPTAWAYPPWLAAATCWSPRAGLAASRSGQRPRFASLPWRQTSSCPAARALSAR